MKYNVENVPCIRKDNGKKLNLTKYSCECSYTGKNLICVHGLTLTQYVFDVNWKDYSFARWMAKEGYTVWLLDVGGYGRSDEYENGFDVNTENAAKDIITAIEVVNEIQHTEKVDLLGWSWGTMTTTTADKMRPDLIRKLVLVAPVTGKTFSEPTDVPNHKEPVLFPTAARLFRHTLSGGDEVTGMTNNIEGDEIDYDTAEVEVVSYLLMNVFRYDAVVPRPCGGHRDIYTAPVDKWLIDAPSVSAPTCMVRGTDDCYNTDELCEELLSMLPEGSEHHPLKGGGHGCYFEKDYYQKFRQVVLNFLEG